ncbi:hypothetical protein ACTOB_001372 [Actinoplanes oblitus]|uniref:Uncharacterized protein n=1 Tax=Actinoplanes oblitus TaxID=3040509 RepID=A0ABY8WL63_9ACTN|nr:hypothetical protein [Actinoplanes oblitus]WIM97818.1 hypothetical protein ACTOB_001372 [Actinoplanes oblitus]
MTAPLCRCGDEQEDHKRKAAGCRAPDCGCARYEPCAPALSADASLAVDVDALLAEVRDDVDREAELRRDLAEAVAVRASVEAERDNLLRELNETSTSLFHARGHMEAYRTQRDQATEAIGQQGTRIAELEALLEQAEQYARDLQDDGSVLPVGRVWDEHVRYLCTTCGSRYREFHNHPCGRLEPVRVRITLIEE